MLQRFTQIRRDEAAPVLASGLAFFFILTALTVLRPAREALGMQRGIEAVRWLFVGRLFERQVEEVAHATSSFSE